MYRAEQPQNLNIVKKAAVDKVPRYVVVHTRGTIKREVEQNGDLSAHDAFQWDKVTKTLQEHMDNAHVKSRKSPRDMDNPPVKPRKSPRGKGGKLPMLPSPRVGYSAPISTHKEGTVAAARRRAPSPPQKPGPFLAVHLPGSIPMPTDAGSDATSLLRSPGTDETNHGRRNLLKSEIIDAWAQKGRVEFKGRDRLQPLHDPTAPRFNLLSCEDHMLPRHCVGGRLKTDDQP